MSIALPAKRFAGIVAKVNAFLLIALVLVAAFLGLVAYKQGWFVHQSPIHFMTANALGINKGMPVKLHGFTIGSVNNMELAQGGVDVRLLVAAPELMVFDALEDGLSYAECRHAARFEAEYRARQPEGTVLYVDTREDS